MKWRRWNNIIHRDLGYLCAGLTIVYVVSGIAVNQVRDWNPNFKIESARLADQVAASSGAVSILAL